jgi:hypothetical protein
VHWWRVDVVLKLPGDLSGNVIVPCSLSMNADDKGNEGPQIAHYIERAGKP